MGRINKKETRKVIITAAVITATLAGIIGTTKIITKEDSNKVVEQAKGHYEVVSRNDEYHIMTIEYVIDEETTTSTAYHANSTKIVEEEITTVVTHTIEYGDSWWNISKEYYNTGKYYNALAEYNNSNPTETMHIGDVIEIPAPSKISEVAMEEGTVISGNSDIQIYKYGQRMSPKVDIKIPVGDIMKNYTEEVDVSEYEYAGTFKTTGYTPTCAHCCGGNTNTIGAMGVSIIPGYSVATNWGDFEFGTTLYIEGYGYYVVEDRGVPSGTIDIACPSHETCGDVTNLEGVKVYIVN